MDARRTDVEGGRALHRERRTRKLALVVAAQNVLVVACLLLTLCGYWGANTRDKVSGARDAAVVIPARTDIMSSEDGSELIIRQRRPVV